MAFGMSKPTKRRSELSSLPDDWVGWLEPGVEVEGDIQSRVVSITGKVKGTVHAKERLEIKEHGIVMGDIYTPCLLVDPGGFFDGQCHMPTPDPASPPPKVVETTEHS